MLSSADPSDVESASPTSVAAPLRLLRWSSRVPICDSSRRIVWLRFDVDVPICVAARVKLLRRATAAKAARSSRLALDIVQIHSTTHTIDPI